jgi:serine/threonine protein phosphatase PrpC
VLFDAMRRANSAVRDGRRRHPDWELMGATLTLALAGGQGLWFVANLGDSPGWVVRPDETRQVTEDHNYAAELLRHRLISPAQAACHPGRHVLSRAIGIEEEVSPSICPVELAPGDRLVLASDGLGGAVDTSLLHDLLGPAGDTAARHQARLLVDLALEGGASDNVTAVVLCRPSSPGGHRPL